MGDLLSVESLTGPRGTVMSEGDPEAIYLLGERQVTQPEFQAFLSTLKGEFDYVCKKMKGGGIVRFTARGAQGGWFDVTLSSGQKTPSSIVEGEAPRDNN